MNRCGFDDVLYFYEEMDEASRAEATAHLRTCADCRQRLDDLHAIRRALAARPQIDAPPAGDWSGFMHRLDEAVRPSARPVTAAVLERRGGRWTVRQIAAVAATVALVTAGVATAARFRKVAPAARTTLSVVTSTVPPAEAPPVIATDAPADPQRSLRAVSAEHLERSKLVVLGLATRDPRQTRAADWQYERQLAGTLLSDTRLYRLTAQDRGAADVARVMRDLETVFLEASLSDSHDRDALQRVQRLIAKRDLVLKMQVMAGSSGL